MICRASDDMQSQNTMTALEKIGNREIIQKSTGLIVGSKVKSEGTSPEEKNAAKIGGLTRVIPFY
jgi:hypothetical protein